MISGSLGQIGFGSNTLRKRVLDILRRIELDRDRQLPLCSLTLELLHDRVQQVLQLLCMLQPGLIPSEVEVAIDGQAVEPIFKYEIA